MAAGAALACWLDPQRGHRRRALARDKAAHALRMQQRMLGRGARDLAHRARGVGPRLSHLRSDHPSDEVLIARVRSELGRHTSHAHAITVEADDGEITLEGPILADEIRDVLRAARRVRGVEGVHDQLEVHDDPGDVPGLQGEGSTARPFGQREQWPPGLRLVSTAGGHDATRVHVRMSYQPPAGAVGHGVAALLGRDPKRAMSRDLQRMQSLLEQREEEQEAASSMPTTQASVH